MDKKTGTIATMSSQKLTYNELVVSDCPEFKERVLLFVFIFTLSIAQRRFFVNPTFLEGRDWQILDHAKPKGLAPVMRGQEKGIRVKSKSS